MSTCLPAELLQFVVLCHTHCSAVLSMREGGLFIPGEVEVEYLGDLQAPVKGCSWSLPAHGVTEDTLVPKKA